MAAVLQKSPKALAAALAAMLAAVALCLAAPGAAWAAQGDLAAGGIALDSALTAQASTPQVSYRVHVQDDGWQDYRADGAVAGTSGRALRLEGINIRLSDASGGIAYQTHVQDVGWQDWKSDGEMAGTTGRALRLEGIRIKLTGDIAKTHDVVYRVHVQDIGWMSWARNGELAGTTGQSKRLEAIEVKLVDKSKAAPSLRLQAHVQDIGWQESVSAGTTCGTTGRGLRVEALRIQLDTGRYAGGVKYQAHVENVGWQAAVTSGKAAGTTGLSQRVEALRITLTGEVAEHYDIFYRVHVADYGWLDWACNGADAGSVGQARRIEAVEVVLVKKGADAPGATRHPTAPSDIWESLEWQYEDVKAVRDLIFVKYEGGSDATVVVESKVNGAWVRKLSCSGYVGSEGIGSAREGIAVTPSGDFGITGAFGIKPNPASKMSYLQVTDAHYWCDDDEYYNTLVDINEKPHYCTGEHLIDYPGAYDYGMFFDYNTNPVVFGEGSAFFLHCYPGTPYTAGCIAVPTDDMIRIIQTVHAGARICIY